MSTEKQTPNSVPFFDLTRQYARMESEILPVVTSVLSTQQFILGETVRRFEEQMASWWGLPHAVGVASGTDALILSLKAAGLKSGETVLVPSFTFYASASSIVLSGGIPLFTEVDPRMFNMTTKELSETLSLRGERRNGIWYDNLTGSRISGIIVVHLYGQMADMSSIFEFAKEEGLWIVEDACQAIGAEYHGKPPGFHSVAAAYSFFPTKNLGGGGDGGMIATLNGNIESHLRSLRVHGSVRRYYHDEIGYNSRLDAIQAAILGVKLVHLHSWNERRGDLAKTYGKELSGIPDILTPMVASGANHVWHQYTIRVTGKGKRDALKGYLSQRGIGSEIYYPLPQHRQPAFAHLPPQNLPVTDMLSSEVLSLPVFPELMDSEQNLVLSAIRDGMSKGG
ncbi:MAG: DegT/DnrJ/EryC1/StrS family aminotransferase [Leptospirillum sp.]